MSPDFRDLLSAFNGHSVDFLVVGAHALAAHGHVRATGDLDVWVRPEVRNATRVRSPEGVRSAPCRSRCGGDRLAAKFAGLEVPVLSAPHLVENKRTVARAQDLADVEWLVKHGKADGG